MGWCGLDLSGSGGQMESSCECGNEPTGYIKVGKLLSGYTTGGFWSSAQLHIVSYCDVYIHL
jgi:hypothetical protein